MGGRLALVLVAVVMFSMGGPLLGQQPTGQGAGTPAAQDEFVPVKDLPQQEQLPGGPLVLAAYGFVWAVLLVYLWTIWRRLNSVEREMRDLSARMTRFQGTGDR